MNKLNLLTGIPVEVRGDTWLIRVAAAPLVDADDRRCVVLPDPPRHVVWIDPHVPADDIVRTFAIAVSAAWQATDDDDPDDDEGEEWKRDPGPPPAVLTRPAVTTLTPLSLCQPVPGAHRVMKFGGALLCPHCHRRIYTTRGGLVRHLLRVHNDVPTARAVSPWETFKERPNCIPVTTEGA